jgi:hypothetical protein
MIDSDDSDFTQRFTGLHFPNLFWHIIREINTLDADVPPLTAKMGASSSRLKEILGASLDNQGLLP